MDQLADNHHISCGGWGEQIKEFFLTSLDNAGQKIGEKMQVMYNSDEAIDRVTHGDYAYYENINFLRHAINKHEQKIENMSFVNESQTHVFSPLHIMRDCVINMPIAIGLQKNSPLKPRVDKFLQRVIEAGLVKKWLGDVMSTVKSPVRDASKALMDLRKMYIAIVALGVGYILGFLALFAELVHWKCVVQRRPHFDVYKKPVKVAWNPNT